MQKQAKQFIELLESQQLLSPDVLEELHRQIAESKTRLTAELLAKLLVENGHLTKFQATKLIAEMKDTEDTAAVPPEDEEELGFAPTAELGGGNAKSNAEENAVAAVFIDEDELIDLNEPVDVEAIDVVDVEPVEIVQAVEAVPSRAVASPAEPQGDFADAPRPSTKVITPPKPKANPWDSFRILGIGLILSLVLIVGFFLVYYFWRGNAEERLTRADDAYEQRSYETAAAMYKEFAEVFPTNERASYAKVRAALAALRKDSEGAPDPQLGLRTALEVLPPIASESGLVDQQSDLAGALIALAGKFNERADRPQATAERKVLMDDLEKLLALINDPQFVGANQRNQQAPTLNRILEDRQRILREINRDEELAVALNEIDGKLEAQDTLAAYDIRKALINRYPLLEVDESLTQRVVKATVIQRSLVEPGSLNATLSKEAPSQAFGRSYVLANRSGKTEPGLAGQVLFVKVKGSVYGLEADTGNILWRQFIGREFNNDPIRLGQTSAADAIICQAEKGWLSRLAGKTGETIWFADLGIPTHAPVVESEDLFVAAFDGTLASLDTGGGQTKWVSKLPQPTPVAPGVGFGKPHLYLPADHSNLYVLSRKDGACNEVYYLGHRAGAIVVPPILLLGQLFVFENIDANSAKIRVLSTSDQGLELKDAQTPITIEGNIIVSPQVDGRRLIVQSDLGQIIVLDIEPTAETQKVTTIASIPKNAFEPRLSWLTADNNRIWVADTRFTRFDLQVALGKLNRAWIRNDGDRFAGPPQRFEKMIVHTRTLRGNQGLRVAAVAPDSGDPIWETDIGIPVSLLAAASPGFDAVNSSGMYFALDKSPLRSEADANPGQGKPAMRFTEPLSLSDGQAVLFNKSRANQLAVYSPNSSTDRQKLRLLSANFGTAAPSCNAIAVGDKLAVGLDNGQLVLVDPSNGSLAASPYQPSMEPGKKVRWNTPAYLEAAQTLIVASDLQKLVRLSVGSELRALTEVDLENRLLGPLVPIGNQVCAVETTASGDALLFFDQTSLAKGASLSLPGRLMAGPFPVAEGCILQTDSKLVAYTAEAKLLWTIDFPNSRLVSAPVDAAGKLIVASRAGGIWAIDPANGQVLGQADTGQALSSAPLVLPAGLLIGSDEGAILALPIPTAQPEVP